MPNVLTIGDKRLGAALLDMGLLEDGELQRALEQHREVGGNLGDIVVELGLLSERRIAQAIEESFGVPLVELTEVEITPEAKAMVPAERARDLGAMPFSLEGGTLRVALLNPLDNLVLEELEDLTNQIIEPYQTTRSSFQYALALHYPELGLSVPQAKPSGASADEMKVGGLLVEKGWISREQLENALVEQEKTGELLGRLLMGKYGLQEHQLYAVLAQQSGMELLTDVSKLEVQVEVTAMLLRPDALRYQAVPVRLEGQQVLVVLSDPRHRQPVAALIDRPTKFVLTQPTTWEALFNKTYPEKSRLGEALVQEGKLNRAALQDALSVQRRMGKTRPLGEVLVELGYVSKDDVEDALQKQRQGGGRLEDTLVQSGKIKPEMLAKSLATQLGYPYIDPNDSPPNPNVLMMVPEATVRRYTVIPHHLEGNTLVVLMKDPRNILAIDDLRMITKKDIMPAVTAEAQISKLIERFYGSQTGVEELAREFENKKSNKEEELDTSALDDNAVVKLVNSILREAFLQEVSDIHIEPRQADILVRFRIDGSLREYMRLPKGAGPAISSRIKIMGNLDIAERRLPQDGRVRYKDRSIDLDLRLSTLPTVYGEKIVMRLLRKASEIPEIEQLGFATWNFQRFEDTIDKPYGIFLITGPTGSGKSFTTFSILKRISTPDKNTTTIEDPVEYEIPGINQTQANPVAGLTFARALRSFLRQDPDIIMVGEIRDSETAKIATEAALTGHLVIATLHTNDAAGAVTRLDEMGVELFNISAALVGVLAQRLVRRICNSCKIEVEPDPNVLRRLDLTKDDARGRTLYKGTGCDKCNGSGYKGRAAIHELMTLEEDVRRAIVEGQSATQIKDIARKLGMKTLREDGIEKAFQGVTTLEEVMAKTNE
ncbi:MAG: ATPase, T2SS/T4P/T4SS family [Meiothermus sp.]|nr:ATPase, T2SS/T4P/T4SS family [Meiothermus sp.]